MVSAAVLVEKNSESANAIPSRVLGKTGLKLPILGYSGAAFPAVWGKCRGLVWSIARDFIGNFADAENVVQEVFVDLWRNAWRFDPAISPEGTLIGTVARRRLIDGHRRWARRPEVAPLDAEQTATARSEMDHLEMLDQATIAGGFIPDTRASIARRKWNRQRIVEVIRLRRQEGKSLRIKDVQKDNANVIPAARLYFGSWDLALKAVEISPSAPEKK
jgi:RNA polymerase sigma factor (sigma-70 family)